jgi:protease-4
VLSVSLLAATAGGCGNPSFLVTPVYPSQNLSEVTVEDAPTNTRGEGGKIAIIELEGLIVNARTGGPLQAQENPVNRFVESLQYAEKDDDVKAVVLRINSPGGAVSASDTLYEEVRRFKARSHKPVIASVQDIGASGAYYVACAADTITVQPTSIVGSVGVIFQTFNVSGTMAKIGVTSDAIKSATNKDAGSPFRRMTEEERALFQKMIDDYYGRFKGIVQSRPTHVPDEQTATAFDGRVFTGEDSVRIGLANQTGYLRDALNQARAMAKAPRAKAVMYRLPFSEQGSIYAVTPAPTPTSSANALTLKLPGLSELPPGFYYLWEP